MSTYLGSVLSSMMSTLFFVFLIGTVGYLIGAIKIKGISLGSAGVLVVALIFGVIASYVPSFSIGEATISLYNSETIKPLFSLISNIGTAMFVTAVGLIAGPKFFRNFNKKSISYILMGFIVIAVGSIVALVIIKTTNVSPAMVIGLLTGALTSTPGLAAAKEAAGEAGEAAATAGYGIAYLFGVLGVVLFVQIMPKILKVNIAEEREKFVAANTVTLKPQIRKLTHVEPFGFFPFFMTVVVGMFLGAIKIPGINFSFGTSGGTLIVGLIVGHFGHVGNIDCSISKDALNFFRELGLILFLIGAGVPGGVNFMANVKLSYFIFGALMTIIPMVVGFILAKYVFKLSIFNVLGSITGGMTSTPALGSLISVAGTDDVASAYAATYPVALVCIVLTAKIVMTIL